MILNPEFDPKELILNENIASDKSLYILNTNDNRDSWYVQICKAQSFTYSNLEILLSADALDQIRNKKAMLILENIDNIKIPDVVDTIYEQIVINGNIPPEQIKLVSWSADMVHWVSSTAQRLGLAEIEFEYHNYWEAKFKKIYNLRPFKKVPTLTNQCYHKKFLCLIKKWRLERCMLFILMSNRNLINQGYVSFTSDLEDPEWNKIINILQISWPTLSHEIDCIDPELNNILPLQLDLVDKNTNQKFLQGFHASSNVFYTSSYFSVVAETAFFRADSGLMITEKILRPIVHCHPFIIAGPDHSLEFLRFLGYRTFEGIIDESYDQETDDSKRLVKIANEIERLCNLTPTELEEFLIKSREICEYNFQWFMTKHNYIYTKEQLLCQQFI